MPPTPGSKLPAATLLDAATGAPSDLAALAAEGPVLLFVTRDDCPGTAVAGPLLPRFGAVPGLSLVAVCQDDAERTRRFAERCGWGGAVRAVVDDAPYSASDALGVRVTPTWILVEQGGRIAAVGEGWARADANRLAAEAAALVGAAPPVVSPEGGAEPAWRPG
ncbi:MAG TPA: hypothetical protein VFP50_05175 [Anaeromyxobacteraceae bacterium]|nr:hypothetical protein [Anaeromyxobacteraceae bacterium]